MTADEYEQAKAKLRNPRGLTLEEWHELFDLVREGNRQRRLAVGGVYRDDADVRPTDVSPPFGYDWEAGAYYVEANSGPGAAYSGATNVPRPTSP